jgi:hypothetical protein
MTGKERRDEMNHEIISELREITVSVRLAVGTAPVISTSRGWFFTPESLHTLWIRENASNWELVCIELRGTLPKSGKEARRTYWEERKTLPAWLGDIVSETTPVEALQVTS